MRWFNIRKQNRSDASEETQDPGSTPAPSAPPSMGAPGNPTLPPHLQRIVGQRGTGRPRPQISVEARRADFERKRLAIQYDIEQGQLASEPDNPWVHRIELLTEALGTVEDDLKVIHQPCNEPYYPLPPTPINDVTISRDPGINVSFTIGGHPFRYAEVLDWAERGRQIAPPDLRAIENDVEGLIPREVPEELRGALRHHLTDSLAVFATDLRDRTLEDEPLHHATLADLARKCPVCGGWADWRGRCDACTNRKAREQSLRLEQNRLLRERANEVEERHRLAERLPIARRRLADLDAEIGAFERSLNEAP